MKQKSNEVLHLTRFSSTRPKKLQKLTEEHDDRRHLETRFTGTQKTSMILYGEKRKSLRVPIRRQVQKVRTCEAPIYPKSQFPLQDRN